jgi:hypothetical protein
LIAAAAAAAFHSNTLGPSSDVVHTSHMFFYNSAWITMIRLYQFEMLCSCKNVYVEYISVFNWFQKGKILPVRGMLVIPCKQIRKDFYWQTLKFN